MSSNTYVNIGGTWTLVKRPYVRQSGVWKPVNEVQIHRSGTWTAGNDTSPIFLWDNQPPPPPELSLTVNQVGGSGKNKDNQYIRLGVRLPQNNSAPMTGIAYIRVLVGGKGPKGTFATNFNSKATSSYISASDGSYPYEPWSDWYYDGYRPGGGSNPHTHPVDTNFYYKNWFGAAATPDNQSLDLSTGVYRFTAWSVDFDGNVSAPVQAQVSVPAKGNPSVYVKSAKFTPTSHGTVTWNAQNNYTFGDLNISGITAPKTIGIMMYSNSVINAIGQSDPGISGTPQVAIQSAQIKMYRAKNDGGPQTATLYMARSSHIGTPADIGKTSTFIDEGPYVLGTLSQGSSAWFDVPAQFKGDLNSNTKSLIFFYAPSTTQPPSSTGVAHLYAPNASAGTYTDAGTLAVVWTESPSKS